MRARRGALRSWSVLASHDTPRAIDVCGDEGRARLAATLRFALPGAPVVFYGEEVGMRGGADPANRAPMRWDESLWNLRSTRATARGVTGSAATAGAG